MDGIEKVREIVFARTGKNLVLPRRPGEEAPELSKLDPVSGEPLPLRVGDQLAQLRDPDAARELRARERDVVSILYSRAVCLYASLATLQYGVRERTHPWLKVR